MNYKSSYFTNNSLYSLIKRSTHKERLPPKPLSPLKPKIYFDETEFNKIHALPTIFELNYYKQHHHKSLPIGGWIKPCINCRMQTGSTFIYSHSRVTRYQHFRIYLCSPCIKQYNTELLTRTKQMLKYYIQTSKFFIPPDL